MKETEYDSSPLSELEALELITTKYVSPPDAPNEAGDVKVEKIRAVGSPLLFSPIERPDEDDDFVLDDYEYLLRPGIKKDVESDHAVILLDRILNSSEEILKEMDYWDVFERSKKWAKTTRASELALVEKLIPMVDKRPTHLHVFCHHLTSSDSIDIIGNAIVGVKSASKKYRSLFRMSMKTQMTFKQFIDKLETVVDAKWTVRVRHPLISSFTSSANLTTPDILGYTRFESMDPSTTTSASFEISVTEKPHVKVHLEYRNELLKNGKREKTLLIEQHVDVKTPRRRATFGEPLVEKIHEFEINQIPFPLPQRGIDLMRYLQEIVQGKTSRHTIP
ncbi:hypothetical protein L5515_012182 [Caenorhabditis briggsae]|uniref:Uncharacterized protein n=1 Tax=Caenorhabditis briggsae TaxID=6238 RepID=A0AAE9EWR4_CAEBR|nr:hypothetical protein L5515_012182 [Caenorhabditis briggsae]